MIENITSSESTQPFSLCIDTISFNSTCMQIYVRNGLDRDLSVVEVYINKKAYDICVFGSCVDLIQKGDTVPIHVLGSFSDGCMYNVKVVFAANYFDENKVRTICNKVGAEPVIVPMFVNGAPGTENVFKLIDDWINKLNLAFAKSQAIIIK